MTIHPKVSVIIPTYKRPDLLKRAIGSVKSQTFMDWELVISDDENPPGTSWSYLLHQATTDHRIKVTQNPGRNGQTRNMNHALSLALGEWIKPLYDDDVLHPTCLEILTKAVNGHESVVLIRCLANQYTENMLSKRPVRGKCARLELISQRFVHLAMYLTDVEIGIPTQVMVRRNCIINGAFLETVPGLTTLDDVWWYHKILKHGDLLLLNEPLVDQHQGKYETITSKVSEDELLHQNEHLRNPFYEMIDPSLSPPPMEIVKKMLRLIGAMQKLRKGKIAEAIRLTVDSLDARAFYLAGRWALRRFFPGHFRMVERSVIEK